MATVSQPGAPPCVARSGSVPVFPLPGVVLFPHTILPLHIFEDRYRDMVRAALDGDGLIAMALLRSGWEDDYTGSPPIHGIGTIGRIDDLESLPDGRFNLNLVGLQKVRFGREVQANPFRVAEVTALAETGVDDKDEDVRRARLEILASHGALLREMMPGGGPPGELFLDETIPCSKVVNGACANLPVDPEIKQELLEESDLMVRQARCASLLTQALEHVLETKAKRAEPSDDAPLLH